MALAPIQFISDFMEDYPNWWLKTYEQGTTTPITMATNKSGSPTVAKAEISAGPTPPLGLIKTAGNVTFIPYVDEAYDAYIFPTEAEADANDTVNAIQLADDVSHLQDVPITIDGILVSSMVGNLNLEVGDFVETVGYLEAGDGGDNSYEIVDSLTGTNDGGSFINLDNGLQAKGLFPGERYNFKQWGAPGTRAGGDSTDAVEAALNWKVSTGRGVTFSNIFGTYIITRSLQIVNGPSNDEVRNLAIIGQGGSNTVDSGCVFVYQATSTTDPTNFQDGIFSLDSTQDFHFENVAFLNEATGINQLVKVFSDAFGEGALSAWQTTFEKCLFQNPGDATQELSNGHVLLYNCLDTFFRDCKFFGSPINVTQGVDPATTTGIAGGFTSRVSYENVYFTGDIILNRTQATSFGVGCTFAEKWTNPQPFTEGAQVIMTEEAFGSLNLGVNFNGVLFEGLFLAAGGTDGAIRALDNVSALNITGCTFGSSYDRGVLLAKDCQAAVITGNYFDLTSGVGQAITLASSFIGSLKEDTNTMAAAMVAANGVIVSDSRTYKYPHLVNEQLGADYSIVVQDVFEKALTSSAVTFPAGRYRVRGVCVANDNTGAFIFTSRVTNTGGYSSTFEAQETVQSNEQEIMIVEDDLYLDGETAVTFSLEVKQSGGDTGVIKFLSAGGKPLTYIQVTQV